MNGMDTTQNYNPPKIVAYPNGVATIKSLHSQTLPNTDHYQ
jgi:hypothetical protein